MKAIRRAGSWSIGGSSERDPDGTAGGRRQRDLEARALVGQRQGRARGGHGATGYGTVIRKLQANTAKGCTVPRAVTVVVDQTTVQKTVEALDGLAF